MTNCRTSYQGAYALAAPAHSNPRSGNTQEIPGVAPRLMKEKVVILS